MKKFLLFPAAIFAAMFIFFACQKDIKDSNPSVTSDAKPVANPSNCTGYQIALDRQYADGKTTFIWTITNPNPGNGSGSTIQDLSHWDFIPSLCLDQNWQSVRSAEYNNNDGTGWHTSTLTGNFVDDIKPDPSLTGSCYGDDVFKFDQGTKGSTPTQYKLVLNGNWGTGNLDVYFKSGTNTGCCFNSYPNVGIGCPESGEECSFSQGYWFANNTMHPDGVHPWTLSNANGTVTIGGKTYTNAEGLAIWNSSNKGGITDSKKAFTQLAAIRLSGADETDLTLAPAIATIECWLSKINKLSGTYLPNETTQYKNTCGDARAAAGVISDWIKKNHCQ